MRGFQEKTVKHKGLLFIFAATILLSACVTIQLGQPTFPPAPTIRPLPTSPQPSLTSLPIFTPIVLPPTSKPASGATRIKIFLIALNDNGATGKKIGCNDSLVPVQVQIDPTLAVLKASLTKLFQQYGQRYYGSSGLYNSLYKSNLSIDSLNIVNREAIIMLKGSLNLGGVCDDPRAKAQLEEIALQFNTIDRVSVFINGVPLNQLLSGQG
jgi:hypothetical protein